MWRNLRSGVNFLNEMPRESAAGALLAGSAASERPTIKANAEAAAKKRAIMSGTC